MKPAVSVIVLVYNSEKYLPKALESLFGQTLKDIEYVIVDDGSTDGSMSILHNTLAKFPERREQVKIISNAKNLGQAESRRRGVGASTGEYVIHCDSDDWIEPDMYEKLYDKALDGDYDMVLCRIDEIDEQGNHVRAGRDDFETGDVLGALVGMEIHHYVLNKLVRRSRYGGMRFPECNMWEDVAIIIQLAAQCKSFGFVDESLYHYVRHPESTASQAPSINKLEQMRANVNLVADYLDGENLAGKYINELRHLKRMVKVYAQRLPRPYYTALYPEENMSLLFDGKITIAEKLGHITAMAGIHGLSDKFKKK